MKIYTNSDEVKKLVAQAFPSYTGTKFSVEPITGEMNLSSNWGGGSRDFYVLIDMATGKHVAIPENGTPFTNGGQVFTLGNPPLNIAVIQHVIFCGKDLGVRVHVHPDNLNHFALGAPVELTIAQKIVLAYTRGRKSSYNGQTRAEMALEDSGLPLAEWEAAKTELISMGMLNKAGAITNDGRNAIGDTWPERLHVPGFTRFGITY